MQIWLKMGCKMTCSICCWTWSFIDVKDGLLCSVVSRKMRGMMEWLDMVKISVYVLILSWNEEAQNIKKIWGWTPNKAPESFTNRTMSLEILSYSPYFPSVQSKVVYSACSKILSLFSTKPCIQDKGRVATRDHQYDSLKYSSSWWH